MKKILLPLFMGSLAISVNAQIENGSFEKWQKVPLFSHPVGSSVTMSSNFETYLENGLLSVTKVTADDNTFMRIENIEGAELTYPGYFIFGKTPNPSGVFSAGNTITDTEMTGISMDLNYEIAEDTEGFILVQFKNGNTPVGEGNYGAGTFFFPITGSQDWETTEFLFDYPIDPSANTCAVVFATADVLNGDLPFAAGSFMEIDNITFIDSESTFQGGDFEFWGYLEAPPIPENCYVNFQLIEADYQRTTESHVGNFALRLSTLERHGNVESGYILMGNKTEMGDIEPTILLADNTLLSFMYKYTGPTDMAEAKVVFYTESDGEFTNVYEHSIELTHNEDYQYVEFLYGNLLEELEISATHMSIEFQSSINHEETPAINGSVLLLDEVTLGTTVGILSKYQSLHKQTVRAYPNPTIGRVSFNFGTMRTGHYRVYNQQGSQIAIRQFSNAKEVVFDLYNYPSGKYVFRFFHNGGTEYSHVIKL